MSDMNCDIKSRCRICLGVCWLEREGVSERFVVCEDVEFTTLYKKKEVLDGCVDCQKFSIICTCYIFFKPGHQWLSMYCCKTAPMAKSEASVITDVGASDLR